MNQLQKYIQLVDELFEMGKAGLLKMRIFFQGTQEQGKQRVRGYLQE